MNTEFSSLCLYLLGMQVLRKIEDCRYWAGLLFEEAFKAIEALRAS